MKKIVLLISIVFFALISCSKTGGELPYNGGNIEAMITSVDIKDKNGSSVFLASDIDTAKLTVSILVKEDTNLDNLKLNLVVSDGAKIKPAMGVLTDFSLPVKYSIISENGKSINDWFILVRAEKPSEAMIISVDDVKDPDDLSVLISSEINPEEFTASILVKERTDLKNLKLSVTISEGATIKPLMEILTDFSLPIEYNITSKNGKTVNTWLISVIEDLYEDNDSGFDYDLNSSEWTLDETKSDNFSEWNDAKWEKYLLKASSDGFNFISENVYVYNNKLRLMADYDGNSFSAGKIKSNFEIGENTYVKIRAKTVNYQAMVNSSILLFDENNEGDSPNSKITLMKTILGSTGDGVPNSFTSSLEQTSLSDEHVLIGSQTTQSTFELNEDYHVYGLERRNGYLRFFFDDKVIWEFETSQYPELSNQLRNLIIGINETGSVEPNASRLPAYLLIDYVEVYNAVNTEIDPPTYGENLVKNHDFLQAGGNAPPHWTVKGLTSRLWIYLDQGHSGSARLNIGHHTAASPHFDVTVSQTINNLPDGIYRLEAWAFIDEGKNGFDPLPRLFARSYGGKEKEVSIDNEGLITSSPWKKYVIDNIYVSNGSCEIGVQGVSPGKAVADMFVDDYNFYKVDLQ